MNESGTHTTGKKIENYVFNYSDFLGKGNFSKCYKARNTLTSNPSSIQTRRSPSKSYNSTPSNQKNSKNCSSQK
jgi:hypothetical protein